jgi:hypothetical protein
VLPPALLLVALAAADPAVGGIGMFRSLAGVSIRAVLADPAGDVVVVGATTRARLPVTPDAVASDYRYSTCGTQIGPGFPNPVLCPDVYVVRIAPDGSLLYGSYLGLTGGAAVGGAALGPSGEVYVLTKTAQTASVVRFPSGETRRIAVADASPLSRLAVDREGNTYIGGTELMKFSRAGETVWSVPLQGFRDLAVNANGQVFVSASSDRGMAVTRFDTDGGRVAKWSLETDGLSYPSGLAIGPDGSVHVAGSAANTHGFLIKLPADLSAPVFTIPLGGESNDYITGLAVLADGSTVVAGATASRTFPVTPDALERCNRTLATTLTAGFLSHLSPDGALLYSSYFNFDDWSSGILAMAVSGDGRLILVGETGHEYELGYYGGPSASGGASFVLRLDPERAPARQRFCVVNSANFASGIVAPGQLITLFGSDIGRGRVLVNGAPAEVLYRDDGQVNAILPADAAAARVEVEVDGNVRESADLRVAHAAPGLFRDVASGVAAAINEDGSRNSREHPAPRGSLLTLFGTGFGGQHPRIFFGPDEAESVAENPTVPGVLSIQVRVPVNKPGLRAIPVNYSIWSEFSLGNVLAWIE